MDVLLHTGVEHPDTAWLLVTAVLTFVAGLGVGAYVFGRPDRAENDATAAPNEN